SRFVGALGAQQVGSLLRLVEDRVLIALGIGTPASRSVTTSELGVFLKEAVFEVSLGKLGRRKRLFVRRHRQLQLLTLGELGFGQVAIFVLGSTDDDIDLVVGVTNRRTNLTWHTHF